MRQAQYKFKGTPLPKDGNPQEQSDWHNVNAPDDVKVGHTVHELGHIIALRESGIGHEGMILGTHPNPRGDGVVHGMTLLPSSMFLPDGTLNPEHLAAFIDFTVSGAAAEKEILGQDSEGMQSDLMFATTELTKAGYTSEQIKDYVNKSYERQREVFRRPSIKREFENAVPFLAQNHHVGKLVRRDMVDKCLAGTFRQSKEEQ